MQTLAEHTPVLGPDPPYIFRAMWPRNAMQCLPIAQQFSNMVLPDER
jgi:hypothetical protein